MILTFSWSKAYLWNWQNLMRLLFLRFQKKHFQHCMHYVQSGLRYPFPKVLLLRRICRIPRYFLPLPKFKRYVIWWLQCWFQCLYYTLLVNLIEWFENDLPRLYYTHLRHFHKSDHYIYLRKNPCLLQQSSRGHVLTCPITAREYIYK